MTTFSDSRASDRSPAAASPQSGDPAVAAADPQRLTTPRALVEAGLAPPAALAGLEAVAQRYAIGLTPALRRLIDPTDPGDPIARQFVPDPRELRRDPAELDDPIGDDARSPIEGLVHRYPDRVLIKLVAVCAVYCRFCFRRERIGPGAGRLSAAAFAAALDYVRARPQIWEVILTGGDPLTLSPRRVAQATAAIAAIGHVRTIRWHTRLPVAAPERITPALARALAASDRTVVVAIHANHPRELTAEARAACRRLTARGLLLVSQTVLLKGVNDDVEVLDALMRAFVEARIKPYYLHHGDLAPGAAHWRTSIAEGQALMRGLRARLSGLALPTYVLDIPGGHGKVPIEDRSLRPDGQGGYWVADPAGVERPYRDRLA
ncbi:L-lysine 2,3-aminomutase [Roseiarcus fermentans]|uniref:L-lysine 2,3-aminomutase n=1 Tax=Roseiarcus fermentans TaxID=1473586 RepID=A0A366ETC6_9HYPH|nr:L-lysine 2,3-aminomutase [Roseiarcus fermentans]